MNDSHERSLERSRAEYDSANDEGDVVRVLRCFLCGYAALPKPEPGERPVVTCPNCQARIRIADR